MKVDLDLDSYLGTEKKQNSETLVTLSTDKIKSNPQARKEFKNIDRLAKTIEKEGQLQRIIITPPDNNGIHTIIAGERRWRACKLLGVDIDCLIKDTDKSIVIQLIENIERDDLTFMEEANHLKLIQEYFKMSLTELAEMINRDKSYVSRYLKIANSSDDFKVLCSKAKIKSVTVADDLEKIYTKNPNQAKRIVDKGLTREILKRTLKNLKKGKSTRIKSNTKKIIPVIGWKNKIDNSIVEVTILEEGVVEDSNGNMLSLNFSDLLVIGIREG